MRTSVFFCYTADILVSNNIQWSIGKKHFRCPYGATHKATCTRFAYTEDVVICVVICRTWTVSCLRCPIYSDGESVFSQLTRVYEKAGHGQWTWTWTRTVDTDKNRCVATDITMIYRESYSELYN